MMLMRAAFVFFALISSYSPAVGQPCDDYSQYSHWIGSLRGIGSLSSLAARGQYVYVGDDETLYGSALQVLDVSDPSSPFVAGAVPHVGVSLDIILDGNYAYVADGTFGLSVFDISSPTSPTFMDSVVTAGSAYSLAKKGNYVFVAEYDGAVRVIDVSDPTNPALAASMQVVTALRRVAVSGDYLMAGGNGMVMFDVSDPTNPDSVTTVEFGGQATSLIVADDIAYVGVGVFGGGNAIYLIDITDPTSPATLGSVVDSESYSNIYSMAVVGETIYAVSPTSIVVVDVSDPTVPIFTHHIGAAGKAVAHVNGYLLLATPGSGLGIVELGSAIPPSELAGYYRGYYINAFELAGDIAYLVYGSSKTLEVVDVSNPSVPNVLGSVAMPSPGSSGRAAISEPYGVFAYSPYFVVVDLSDPTSPAVLGSTDCSGCGIYGLAVSWPYAYVMGYSNGPGFHVFDMSQPSSPTEVNFIPLANTGSDLCVEGDYLYSGLLCYNCPVFQIYDISTPSQPVLLSGVEGYGSARVAVDGGYAYVGVSSLAENLLIVDVSDPESPSVVDDVMLHDPRSLSPPPTVAGSNLGVADGYAYVTEGVLGIFVVDVSSPGNSSVVGSFGQAHLPFRVAVSNGRVLCDERSDQGYGLFVYPGQCPSATGIRDVPLVPTSLNLTARPNPFNPETVIEFTLPRKQHVHMQIVDVAGRLVAELADQVLPGGRQQVTWNGHDRKDARVASGVYFAVLETGDERAVEKLVVVK